jgi:hypothetical protein
MKTPISIVCLVRGYSLLQCSNSHATRDEAEIQRDSLCCSTFTARTRAVCPPAALSNEQAALEKSFPQLQQ